MSRIWAARSLGSCPGSSRSSRRRNPRGALPFAQTSSDPGGSSEINPRLLESSARQQPARRPFIPSPQPCSGRPRAALLVFPCLCGCSRQRPRWAGRRHVRAAPGWQAGKQTKDFGGRENAVGGSPPSLSSHHAFSSRARLPAAQHPSPLSLGDGNGFGFGAGPPGGMAVPQPCWWLCSLSHRPAAVGRGRQRGLLMPRSLTRLHPTACKHPALTGTGLILHPHECFLGGYQPAGHRRVGEGWSVCRVGQRDGSLAERVRLIEP